MRKHESKSTPESEHMGAGALEYVCTREWKLRMLYVKIKFESIVLWACACKCLHARTSVRPHGCMATWVDAWELGDVET